MAKRPSTPKSPRAAVRPKQPSESIGSPRATGETPSIDPQRQRRVVVEAVRPIVDAGRFPIKRVPGETVTVTADIFADGHDELAAVVLYRKAGDAAWREAPMAPTTNDRWLGRFSIDSIGTYEYTVE